MTQEHASLREEHEGDKHGRGGMNQTGNLCETRDRVYPVFGMWYKYSEYWLSEFLLALGWSELGQARTNPSLNF